LRYLQVFALVLVGVVEGVVESVVESAVELEFCQIGCALIFIDYYRKGYPFSCFFLPISHFAAKIMPLACPSDKYIALFTPCLPESWRIGRDMK
jgi:hypothetical protein